MTIYLFTPTCSLSVIAITSANADDSIDKSELISLLIVRLSVCLSVREDISGTMRVIFIKCCVHVVYGHGSVLLRQSDEITRERGSFFRRGFFPMQCIVQHSIWDPYNNG